MNALFSSESNRPNNRWWLFWILFGTVGYGLGFGISICGYLALWSTTTHYNIDSWAIVFVSIVGITVGAFQGLLLRESIAGHWISWVVASVIGWISIMLITSSNIFFLAGVSIELLLKWAILRRHSAKPNWWFLTAFSPIVNMVGYYFTAYAAGYTNSQFPGPYTFLEYVRFAVSASVYGVVVGFLVSAITGLSLLLMGFSRHSFKDTKSSESIN
jgi:hypothetical protein